MADYKVKYKRYANGTWNNIYFETPVSAIAATGTRNSSTALFGDGSWKTVALGNHTHTIGQITGLQGALDDKSQRIILTGQLQTTSYRRSVIALCELTNTNPSANSYSVGTLTFHRTNGLTSAVKYDFAIEKRYNTEGFHLSQTVLSSAGFIDGIKPCIFIKNGIKYGGIEVFFSNAELREIEFHGTTNFEIFGLDYYVTNTSTPLDTEVNNSLVLDDPTNIRVSDSFKTGNQLVVLNNDSRLTDARPASDVQSWAKESTKPSYNLGEISETTTYKRVTTAEKTTWNNKVDKVSGKGLSTNDYTTTEKNKLSGIQAGAQVNAVTTVAGRTGAVVLAKADVGLGSVQNYAIASKTQAEAGTSNVLYMTPLRTKELIAVVMGDIESALDAILGV